MTRRAAIVATVVGTAAAAIAAGGSEAKGAGEKGPAAGAARMPVVYLPHGGGPWPFADLGFSSRPETEALTAYLQSIATIAQPRALLVVSAHWEAATPTVMTAERPPLLFDYYGFPPETYRLTWPAPGDPALAARTRELLGKAGFASADDPERGFDHGTFVPLKVAFPAANVPTVQVSLKSGLDPAEHLAVGRALAPLRDEGVLIVGSGMSYHNMRGFMSPASLPASKRFEGWLETAVQAPQPERDAALARWTTAPSARECHPREEHLLPLMVAAGAAGADRGRLGFRGEAMGVSIASVAFG
jgi:aromatic ring-opening dioxygenase catalytic subunit (LigB family)